MQILLALHITGAFITACIISGSVFAVYKNFSKFYMLLAKAILGCSIFQVLTGVIIFAMQPTSIASFCARVGLYLVVVCTTAGLLYWKARKHYESHSRI